ncbi:MAG TPA: DUF2158 domain-containing protein [Pyrinomonadaceae bacterium]|jgi:uncharacterized protein YodC (DUF2158 family)
MGENKPFKVGDIVQLKSGGPKMTVKDPMAVNDNVHCQWFAGSKLNFGYFSRGSLVKIEGDEESDRSKR